MPSPTNHKDSTPRPRSIKRSIMSRVRLLYLLFALIGAAVFAMILVTQYGPNGVPLRNRSDYKCFKTLEVAAGRGNIYSHDGRILATDSPSYDIVLDFTVLDIEDDEFDTLADALADSLSRTVPEHSREYFSRRLHEIRTKALAGGAGSQSQSLMKGKVNQLQLDRIKTFPIFDKGRLGGGFIYTQDPERYKPFGTLAARTLGKPGEFGLEASLDTILSGHDGRNLCVRLVRDVWVPVVDEANVDVRHGRDIVTTIDVNMQDIAESELRKQLIAHNAIAGTAMIMEVATGEVRAISNLTRHGATVSDDQNHAITMRTEPGSTFKLVSLMALLDEAGYDINTTVDCTSSGRYNYQPRPGGRIYPVEDTHAVGRTTIMGVMEHSSNIGFVKLIDGEYRNSPERFTDFVRSLGIDRPIGMQLSGGLKPVIKDPRRPRETAWDAISLMKMAYGYAVEITPAHTLMLYNAVANDGVMVAPRLVREVIEDGKPVEMFPMEVVNERICSPATLATVRESLEGVVERGTGMALKNDNYKIAGKTGTAQIAIPGVGYITREGGRQYLATFVGYFPADNPRYSCIVAIKTYNGPGQRNTFYGASLALPAFKAIADRVYALDAEGSTPLVARAEADTVPVKGGNIAEIRQVAEAVGLDVDVPRREVGWAVTTPEPSRVEIARVVPEREVMPQVTGMGFKDALYLLENQGLRVKFEGKGKVVAQSVAQGDPVAHGDEVLLTLR